MIVATEPRPVIRRWLICISGFLQSEGRLTGMVRLWSNLRSQASAETAVELRAWNDNWSDLAELIWRFQPQQSDEEVQVDCFCYSWGCGHGFVELARELRKRGLRIRHAVLSDPVYYSRFCLTRWLALLQGWPTWGLTPRILVPDNVDRVWWFRQSMNRPAGHSLVPLGERTVIEPPQVLACEHAFMDDARYFHDLCGQVASHHFD